MLTVARKWRFVRAATGAPPSAASLSTRQSPPMPGEVRSRVPTAARPPAGHDYLEPRAAENHDSTADSEPMANDRSRFKGATPA